LEKTGKKRKKEVTSNTQVVEWKQEVSDYLKGK